MKPLNITLPVMLHKEQEISAFKEAQGRLKALGERYNVPIEVGAFLLYLPGSSRTPEAFAQQIKNQTTHRLPIRLVETGVQQANSLAYSSNDPTFKPDIPSGLERTLEQAAVLRDLDPTASGKLVVAPQVGVLVIDSLKQGDFSFPSGYSVPDFLEHRDQLYQRAKELFDQLRQLGSRRGLDIAIENTFSAVFEPIGSWEKTPKDQPPKLGINYQVFQDRASLVDLSQGNLVLDAGHLAAMQNIPARFKQNEDIIKPYALFATLGISTWEEFPAKVGTIADYLQYTRAFHLSPTDGLGIRVHIGSPEGKRWGDGTGPDLITPEIYSTCLNHASANSRPVAIEVDYSLKPLTYKEADTFLEARLQALAPAR